MASSPTNIFDGSDLDFPKAPGWTVQVTGDGGDFSTVNGGGPVLPGDFS